MKNLPVDATYEQEQAWLRRTGIGKPREELERMDYLRVRDVLTRSSAKHVSYVQALTGVWVPYEGNVHLKEYAVCDGLVDFEYRAVWIHPKDEGKLRQYIDQREQEAIDADAYRADIPRRQRVAQAAQDKKKKDRDDMAARKEEILAERTTLREEKVRVDADLTTAWRERQYSRANSLQERLDTINARLAQLKAYRRKGTPLPTSFPAEAVIPPPPPPATAPPETAFLTAQEVAARQEAFPATLTSLTADIVPVVEASEHPDALDFTGHKWVAGDKAGVFVPVGWSDSRVAKCDIWERKNKTGKLRVYSGDNLTDIISDFGDVEVELRRHKKRRTFFYANLTVDQVEEIKNL